MERKLFIAPPRFTQYTCVMSESLRHTARPDLIGRSVSVYPSTLEDLELFQRWRENHDPQLRETQPVPIKGADYWTELAKRRLADPDSQSLTVVRNKDDAVVGSVIVSDINLLNRSGKLELFADPESADTREYAEGVALLLRHLFNTYNLNSVYTSVTAADSQTVALLEELGFSRDGTLRQRHFYRGEFGDVYIYSLLRFEFEM